MPARNCKEERAGSEKISRLCDNRELLLGEKVTSINLDG
jgi:hypothetical protein